MIKKSLITLSLAAAFAAHAQQASPPSSPSSPAKKEAVARILKVQQPSIEAMARALVQQPAAELMGNAGIELQQRVPREKQEAIAKEIQGDVQKFVDESVPVVQKRAVALAPTTLGTLLEERMTEDELRQVATILESPAFVKFQGLSPDMQKVLAEKLVADTRPSMEPKLRALEQTVAKRLGITPGAGGPVAPGAAAPNGKAPPAKK
ncbi:hypothetical protein [Ramlibacter tataouinensis]|nr:hypothetical protein [Ramlibacter tataouinensis]